MTKPTSTIVSSCAAALLMAAAVAAQPQQAPASAPPVTVAGCVQRDSADAKSRAQGRDVSDEFLLVGKTTFALSGTQERQLGRYVGRRVEILGTIEPLPRDQQQPTGGSTDPVSGAGSPPGVPAAQARPEATTAAVQGLSIISVNPLRGGCR